MKKLLYVCLLSLLIQNFALISVKANGDDIVLMDNEYNTVEEL